MHWNQFRTWFQQIVGRGTGASLESKAISIWRHVVVVSNSCSKAIIFRFLESHKEF